MCGYQQTRAHMHVGLVSTRVVFHIHSTPHHITRIRT